MRGLSGMVDEVKNIRKNWEEIKIGDLCKLINGRAFKPTEWTETGLPIIRIQNLNDETKPFNYFNGSVDEKHKITNGDVLISWSGTPSTSFGAHFWNRGDGVLNQHIFKVQVNSIKCLKQFFVYAINWRLDELICKSQGGVGLRHITKGNLENITIPIPYLDIQRRIVARIESLLGEIKRNRLLLEQMRLDNKQLLDSAIKECFSVSRMEMWKNSVSLDKVATITAKQVDPTLSEYQNLPHIGVDAIQGNTCQLGNYRTIAEDGVTSGKYLFTSGSILYSKIRPYLRKSVLVDFEGLCSADIYPLSVISDKIEPKFLMWFLVSPIFTDYVNSQSSRARIPKINRNALFSFDLVYPEYQEQIAIISYLDLIKLEGEKIDMILKEDEQNFNYLEQAILEKAFRGEL